MNSELDRNIREVTPRQQSWEASCVPTSIFMVLEAFGININEQDLVNRYFPTALLPAKNIERLN